MRVVHIAPKAFSTAFRYGRVAVRGQLDAAAQTARQIVDERDGRLEGRAMPTRYVGTSLVSASIATHVHTSP